MSAETHPSINSGLSPRAGIAMLTLQLRATTQEAEALQQQYVEIDHEAAKRELRARLEPLIAERTRTFTEAIDQAKAEAATMIAAAEREAEAIRAAQRAAAEETDRLAVLEAAERLAVVEEAERLVAAEAAATPLASIADDPVWQLDADPADVDVPEEIEAVELAPAAEVRTAAVEVDDAARTPSPFARRSAPLPPPQQINVSIDAEAFAKVFATVFAAIVDQRVQQMPPVPYLSYAIAPAAPAVPAKQGFWRHARHPDVLLLGVATAIVLVVLAAWLA